MAENNGIDILFDEGQQETLKAQQKLLEERERKIAEAQANNADNKTQAEILKEVAQNDKILMKAILSEDEYNKVMEYDTDITKRIKESVQSLSELNNKSIIKYIELGKILLEAKKMLGSRFYFIITDELIAQKQVQRYIKLVLTKDSEEKYAKSMKAKKEDIDSIKVDKRIAELTEDSIKDMKNPSMAKLLKMKSLNAADFKKVVSGNDEPYKNLLDKESKENKAEKEKEILDNKPDGMDEKVYKQHLKDGIYDVIKKYQASIDKQDELSLKVKELERELKTLERMYEKKAFMISATDIPFKKEAEPA